MKLVYNVLFLLGKPRKNYKLESRFIIQYEMVTHCISSMYYITVNHLIGRESLNVLLKDDGSLSFLDIEYNCMF